MIYKTDKILINGTNQVYNGYIYNLDYQPSFGQNPSYCTLNLISEDGSYSINQDDLQVLSPDTINIGTGISLQMYPVKYKETLSPAGKILEVRYIDTSIILDKKIVVLNGRQGNDGTANTPINPVPITNATGFTGNASNFVYTNDKFQGSCYIPLGQELFKVGDTINTVLPVVYTFPQLCDGIAYNGITISSDSFTLIQNSSQYYAQSYIGSLRNVLAQWCNDLGYGFFWEDNQLHFIDLTVPLILDTSQYDNSIKEATSIEVTIEDTVGRVACAFYGQDKSITTIQHIDNTSIIFGAVTLTPRNIPEANCFFNISNDNLLSIQAAYQGFDFFFAYHFQLNNAYGNTMLGINKRIPKLDTESVLLIGTEIKELDSNFNPIYNSYWYVSMSTAGIAQANYKIFSALANDIGKYYFRPMSYGDYRQITATQYNIGFVINSTLVSANTPLSRLAANLGVSNLRIDEFLDGNAYATPASANVIPDPKDTPFDNTEGFGIITLADQTWFFNGQPYGQDQITPYLQLIAHNMPEEVELGAGDLRATMEITNPGTYDTVLPNSGYKWVLVSAQTYLGDNSFASIMDLVSPDIQNPILSDMVTITTPVYDIFPKIEEFFRSETDKENDTVNCNSNVIKNELNYREISNADMTVLGTPLTFLGRDVQYLGLRLILPAAPNPANLDEAFIDFTKNLTFSKVTPTIVNTYSLPYIDIPNYIPKIGQGLISLNVRIDEKGISSLYTFGTRLMQIPSIEVIRTNLSFLNKTNQSAYLPYGFNFFSSN